MTTENTAEDPKFEILQDLLLDMLGVTKDDVQLDTKLGDLGCDSLDLIEICIAVEEKFEVEIPDVSFDWDTTCGHVLEFLNGKRKVVVPKETQIG